MEEISYLDSHAHLMSEEYNEDIDEVIQQCIDKHIDLIMLITLKKEETIKAIEYKKKYPNLFKVAAGIFPEDIDERNWDDFEEMARKEEVDVIGEIGLDYYWVKDEDKRATQREMFIKQIQLANELHKPYAVHSRDAIQDTFDIMKKYGGRGLLHCYSGTKEMAKEFTKLGFYIALGGALTFKNARHSVEVASTIDAKWLLTETDCPYMAPVPVRGTRNVPTNIPYITQKMAEVRNISEKEMADTIMQNWYRYLEK